MSAFLDAWSESLNRSGEELCGDTARIYRNGQSSILVLSDGLGSGVKANILSTLTSQILVSMLKRDVPLADVIQTVVATLPVCTARQIAYATFTVVQFDHASCTFKITNFDNPPVLYYRQGKLVKLDPRRERIFDREIRIAEGKLEMGDFLGLISDGMLHAGPGRQFNPAWSWDALGKYLEGVFRLGPGNARYVVHSGIKKTRDLYGADVQDDATFLGAFLRQTKALTVFTGPPLDRDKDKTQIERFLGTPGRRVVCGGTTAEMIAAHLGETIESDDSTRRDDVPPVGYLGGVDLVTEGILTLARALDHVRTSHGNAGHLPSDRNAAVLLAREFLQADSVHFIVGDTVNPYYQNPQLPRNVSIRRALVEQIAHELREKNKVVSVEYC
ncbi:MAG TPA: SpoIIE family protein phosphatase [Terriglobales bacterium]|nr:SpoIIE family protein phosphatase [Terriglobales bacterium]